MPQAIRQNVYDFSAQSLDGTEISLDKFKGHVLIIVNTASKCGFTPQYAGLETLYKDHKDRGLVVLGFPCNQFGGQEPGDAAEIGAFCGRNYGVSFPLFDKINVNGPLTHPLFDFLKKQRSGIFGTRKIKWNFTKFLVDRKGKVVSRHAPSSSPASLAVDIEKLLAKA